MPKGGARSRSGPAPDPNAIRRDRPSDQAGWTVLDRRGRRGTAPAWPLTKASPREVVVWRRQWKRPQAIEWERNGQEEEVAIYVRALVVAEDPSAPTSSRVLVRQLQDSLGISLPGMQRLRWHIGEPKSFVVDADGATKKPRTVRGTPARDRFRVIDGGG